jgi:hypothetical protein
MQARQGSTKKAVVQLADRHAPNSHQHWWEREKGDDWLHGGWGDMRACPVS